MKKYLPFSVFLLLIALLIASCAKVPLTGRKQINLIPGSQIMSMSFQQYDQFLKENRLSTNQEQTAMVKHVGQKIQHAVESYFSEKGLSKQLKGFQWEFNLVDSPEANAWCMPGGKVVFYTGILPITKDEAGLAVVMGHEIAHAIAEHGNERMSQGLITELGGIALSVALQEKPEQTQALWLTAYGLGSQVGVMLPFSRLHESEADRLGLIFMAMAGYDPEQAVSFWQRMADMKGGQAPPEFLSTHPSDAKRIEQIKKWLPEAMQYYKKQSTPTKIKIK
ncbi:MAG: M48 family metallopeptidase [Bacteroidales bacterium]|jgi:predicted Zn-dependent protease|nr:M48 family metallopeptidase [Bacteroidales bacterium]MDD3702308.1 M48 family metallopeptidase [Bacteroidales bacterium]MDY0370721.1 M48 family metallopeptidase [Bacteroidales bacterium]